MCRNDAGLAAAEVALAVEASVLETGAIDAVGTTGDFARAYAHPLRPCSYGKFLEISVDDLSLTVSGRCPCPSFKIPHLLKIFLDAFGKETIPRIY